MSEHTYRPKAGFVVTHFLTVSEIARSADFYTRILGGKTVREGEPTIVELANTWVILSQIGQPLKSEGLDNGTAVFQITLQQSDRELPFLGVEQKPWNHDR